jgi:hypothetical protein
MNKIPVPAYDDALAIASLANNDKVKSHPHLQPLVPVIQGAYAQYVAAAGNAFNVTKVPLSAQIEDYLKNHYKSPNKDIAYITTMRGNSGHKTCPMCGSFLCGTLDHLLPKTSYAAFAVFSKNLVPACKCNEKRKETLIGKLPNQRVLHPYFDNCLSDRLLGAEFSALGPVPLVTLKVQVPATHADYSAICFHVRSIVEQTSIKNWLLTQWDKLCRKPSLVVRELKRDPPSLPALRDLLLEERACLDEYHESKNNWESIFITGLLDGPVTNWLYGKLLAPGRLPDGSLV